MSRSYTFKPELKKTVRKGRSGHKVVLSDYDIEFIEMSLGPNIRLQM
ncbi:MAG: hypothetical protein JWO47_800 [Candidatus Saccharibacteria bacterium]|nr:hypothetical protein [Candidatus Saccharibacteria bacterium]